MNRAIREHLDRNVLERERWQETLEALGSASLGKVVDEAAVHQWLLSWGTDDELPTPKLCGTDSV